MPPSALVLDSSVAVAWCFADEGSPQLDTLLDDVGRHGATVPGLWRLEVANVLRMAVRRGRMAEADLLPSLEQLSRLRLAIDPHTNDHAWRTTLTLAARHRLTVYDAAYLELAVRLGASLASLDRELCEACRANGVSLALHGEPKP